MLSQSSSWPSPLLPIQTPAGSPSFLLPSSHFCSSALFHLPVPPRSPSPRPGSVRFSPAELLPSEERKTPQDVLGSGDRTLFASPPPHPHLWVRSGPAQGKRDGHQNEPQHLLSFVFLLQFPTWLKTQRCAKMQEQFIPKVLLLFLLLVSFLLWMYPILSSDPRVGAPGVCAGARSLQLLQTTQSPLRPLLCRAPRYHLLYLSLYFKK